MIAGIVELVAQFHLIAMDCPAKCDNSVTRCSTLGYSATRSSLTEAEVTLEDPRVCFVTNLDTQQVVDLRQELSPQVEVLWTQFFPWPSFRRFRYILLREKRKRELRRLWKATESNDFAAVEGSLKGGVLPQTQGLDGWSPLHAAAARGYRETAEVLLRFGAWVDSKSNAGCTPLHLAADIGSVPLIHLLLLWNADIDSHDQEMNSALHRAARNGHLEAVQFLLAHGALCSPNGRGETPWTYIASSPGRELDCTVQNYGRVAFGPVTLRCSRGDVVAALLRRTLSPTEVRSYRFLSQRLRAARPSPLQEYTLLAILGSGSFGHVYLAQHNETTRFYALKILSKRRMRAKKVIQYTLTEKRILQSLTHPFIVRVHRVFQTASKLVLVLDYCAGGTLSALLEEEGRLTEERARLLLSELVLALEALHSQHVIYRDLKPDNVLLTSEGHAVLCDFGLAKAGVCGLTSTFCGTPMYLAPELLCAVPYGFEVDWYALGELLFEMLTDRSPFYAVNSEELFASILAARLTIPRYVSKCAKDLILRLMNPDPAQRLGHLGAQQVKEHPFFADINWQQALRKELPVQPPQVEPLVRDSDIAVESEAGSFLSNWSN